MTLNSCSARLISKLFKEAIHHCVASLQRILCIALYMAAKPLRSIFHMTSTTDDQFESRQGQMQQLHPTGLRAAAKSSLGCRGVLWDMKERRRHTFLPSGGRAAELLPTISEAGQLLLARPLVRKRACPDVVTRAGWGLCNKCEGSRSQHWVCLQQSSMH
jgi:hypothetical protein